MPLEFDATLALHGKTATGFVVPDEIVEELGAGKRPAVKVTIRGHTYRSTIARRGDRYLLGVSAQNREGAGVAAGEEVKVEVELDTEPREVTVPDDLAAALASDPRAADFYATLSYSQQQWYVLPIEEAKKPETRERRVEKALKMLREGRKR